MRSRASAPHRSSSERLVTERDSRLAKQRASLTRRHGFDHETIRPRRRRPESRHAAHAGSEQSEPGGELDSHRRTRWPLHRLRHREHPATARRSSAHSGESAQPSRRCGLLCEPSSTGTTGNPILSRGKLIWGFDLPATIGGAPPSRPNAGGSASRSRRSLSRSELQGLSRLLSTRGPIGLAKSNSKPNVPAGLLTVARDYDVAVAQR